MLEKFGKKYTAIHPGNSVKSATVLHNVDCNWILNYYFQRIQWMKKTYIYFSVLRDLMHKQTTFVITAAILLTAIVSAVLYNVKATNAQGNMPSAGGANMTKGNMTGAAMGAAKNMTSNMSTAGKAMVIGKAMNNDVCTNAEIVREWES